MAIPELRLQIGIHYGAKWEPNTHETQFSAIGCSHSWLVTPDGAIIDAYPVGFLTHSPVLYVGKGEYAVFGSGFYRPLEEVLAEVSADQEVHRKSRLLLGLFRRANLGHEAEGVLT
jgi:hypothetical protein